MPDNYTYFRFGNVAVRQSTADANDVQAYSWDLNDWADSPSHWERLTGLNGEAGMSYDEISKAEADKIIAGGEPEVDENEGMDAFK